MKLNGNALIRKSDNVLEAPMEGSMALMSMDNGEYYGLNPVGKAIWEQLDVPTNLNDIVSELMNQFTIDLTTCEKETVSFIEELEKRKIITIEEIS